MRTTDYLSIRGLRYVPLMMAFLLLGFIAFGAQPAANLDQVRNGPSTAPLSPAPWQNGNVNSSQAHFIEGYSIPYRVVMTNLTVGVPIQLQIEYDTKHSGGHAIDFMTYFDNLEPHSIWGHPAEVVDPLLGLSGVPTTPVYATIPVMDSGEVINGLLQPQTAFLALPANMKRVTLYGGTFAASNPVTYVSEGSILGDAILTASTDVLISFTPTSTTAVLAWGGHIATEQEFGVGKSASGISGSPYHTRLISWNLNNLGNQDRSLQAAAVLILPDCSFTADHTSPVCTNTTIVFHRSTIQTGVTYAWSVINHGTNATPPSGTDTIFTVNSGTLAGNFDVRLIASSPFNGSFITDTCFMNIVVNKVTLSTSVTNVLCFGGSTGAINLTASGGTTPYTFVWSASAGGVIPSGQTNNEDLTGLVAGTYSVTVTDAAGCSASTSANVTQPASAVVTNATFPPIPCNNGTTTVTVTATGGTGAYSFALDGGAYQGSGIFTGVAAGAHTAYARDANGCIDDFPFNITNPTAVVANATFPPIPCNNGTTTVTVTATGGTGTYTFALDGSAYQASGVFTGVSSGAHTAFAKDANGCIDDFPFNITNPTAVVTNATFPPIPCNNGTTTVTVTATGGTGTYTFALDGSAYQASGVFTGVSSGAHTAFAKDANGCIDDFPFNITNPTAVVTNATFPPIPCNNGTTTVTVTATGGTGTYTFALDGSAYQASGVFTGVSSGAHTAFAKDANGCIDDFPLNIANPTAVVANATFGPITCNNGTTTVTVTATGGTGTYTFALDGSAYQASGIFTGVSAGAHTAFAKDANGCIDDFPFNITNPSLVVANATFPPIPCNNGTTTVTVTATGGTGTYTFALDGSAYQASGVFTGVSSGAHTAFAKDGNGCIDDFPFNITNPTAVVTNATFPPIPCNNGTTTVTITATGGTGTYTFALDGSAYQASGVFTGVSSGAHTAFAKDANGCIDDFPFNITNPTAVVTNATFPPIPCNNGTTTVTVTATGGTGTYTFALDGSAYQASGVFTGVSSGAHTAFAKDGNGCIDDFPFNITNPTAVVTNATFTPIPCNNGTSTVTVTATGGTGTYTFALDGSAYQASGVFTGVSSGAHTAYAKDGNGCIDDFPFNITNPTAVVTNATFTPIPCNNGTSTVTVTATGGTGTYTFALDGSAYQASGVFTGVSSGAHTAYAKDGNGCIDDFPFNITNPAAVVTNATFPPIPCNNGTTTVTVTATGGTGTYTFALDGSAYQASGVFTGVSSGAHTAYAKDGNGCIDDFPFNITNPTAVVTNATFPPILCNNGTTTVTVTATGGTGTYTFALDGSAYQASGVFTGVSSGAHTAYAKDGNGCIDDFPFNISNPALLSCSIQAPSQNPACGSQNNSLTATVTGGTGTITYLWSVTGSGWSITTNGSATAIYTAGSGSATFNLLVTDANNCTSTCSVTFDCISNQQFCSLTQGFYGNAGGYYCNGQGTYQLIDSLLMAHGGMVIGVVPNNKTFTIPNTGAQCVIDILPGGGGSSVLPGNNGCGNFGNLLSKKGTLNNILLAQTITLKLNLWLTPSLGNLVLVSPEFYTRSSSSCGTPNGFPLNDSTHFLIPADVYAALGANKTVQGIFNMANNALGGVTGLPPLADINNAVDIINTAFDECAFIYFIGGTSMPTTSGISTISGDQMNINLSIVPNPFEEQAAVNFTLSQDSRVSVEIYNMIGVKVATLYEGQALADQLYTFKYVALKHTGQQTLLCVIRTPKGHMVKEMVLIR